MPITFRPAQPQDFDVVLPLIYSSGPAQFEHLFTQPGKPAQDFLHWAFATGLGLFGYHIYTVAVVDQRPVAVGAAYGRQQANALERQLTFQIIRFYGLFSAWSVLKHAIELDALTHFPERDMQHQIVLARAKGYRRCGWMLPVPIRAHKRSTSGWASPSLKSIDRWPHGIEAVL